MSLRRKSQLLLEAVDKLPPTRKPAYLMMAAAEVREALTKDEDRAKALRDAILEIEGCVVWQHGRDLLEVRECLKDMVRACG